MAEEAVYDFDDDRGLDESERPGEGCYHVKVVSIDEHGGKDNNQLKTSFAVLSPGPYEGLVYDDYIPMSHDDWARKKRYKLAIVLGLTTLEALKRGGVTIDWDQAVGEECVLNLIADKWEDKNGNERVSYKAKWPENYVSLSNKAAIAKLGCVMAGEKPPEQKAAKKAAAGSKAEAEVSDEIPF